MKPLPWLLGSSLLLCATLAQAEDLYIQIKDQKLRSQPKVWASAVADLAVNQRVTLIDKAPFGWLQVRTEGGKTGYVHERAVDDQRLVLTSGGAVSGVEDSDRVAATKGFDSKVEAAIRQQSPELNYAAVDKVERSKVSADELRSFIQSGKLKG